MRGAFASTLVAPGLMAACNSAVTDKLTQADAARWLQRTCGLVFNVPPLVISGSASFTSAPHGVANFVSGTIAIHLDEVTSITAALKRNVALTQASVGNATLHFESAATTIEHRTCDLDPAKGTLFFEYRD